MEKITTKEELVSVLLLCSEFLAESRYGDWPLAQYKAIKILEAAQRFPEKFFIKYHMNAQKECVGIFIGMVDELFCSTVREARDICFYVRPDYRGSSWFVKTLKKFEDWAKEQKADLITLYHNTGIKTAEATAMFNKLGYGTAGVIFSKEI